MNLVCSAVAVARAWTPNISLKENPICSLKRQGELGMAPTRIPRCTLLLILLLMVASSSAQLSMELKQYLLDSHNGARRDQPAGNMRAMVS